MKGFCPKILAITRSASYNFFFFPYESDPQFGMHKLSVMSNAPFESTKRINPYKTAKRPKRPKKATRKYNKSRKAQNICLLPCKRLHRCRCRSSAGARSRPAGSADWCPTRAPRTQRSTRSENLLRQISHWSETNSGNALDTVHNWKWYLDTVANRYPFSKACLQHPQTVIQPGMWFMEEPSQFSVGQTAQSLTCSMIEKPHTGVYDSQRMLPSCFR